MIKTDPFSGHTYTTTGSVKMSDTGETFTKTGSFWFGSNGKTIQETKDGFFNLHTGVQSSFGDPFQEDNDE